MILGGGCRVKKRALINVGRQGREELKTLGNQDNEILGYVALSVTVVKKKSKLLGRWEVGGPERLAILGTAEGGERK